MKKKVLAITYTNAHRAVFYASAEYCRLIREQGYDAEVVELTTHESIKQLLDRLMTEEFAFCFGIQGVGSTLSMGGNKIWSVRRIPFICLHFDPPSSNIFNHASDSPYVANLYCFESMREIHQTYIKTPQIVDVMPFEIYSTPAMLPYTFKQRPVKLSFIKSGENLDQCIAEINNLPSPLSAAIWEQLDRAQTNPNLQLCDLARDIFAQKQSGEIMNFDLFWGIVHWMDMYIRRKRAIDFVNWLKFQNDAVIIGDGWDFIDKTGSRAAFKGSIDGHGLYQLYLESKFVCNANLYGRDIIHERATSGLAFGACVISDANMWWVQHFADVPALTLFDWNRPLDEQLNPVIENMEAAEHASHTGRPAALQKFTGHRQIDKILQTQNAVHAFAEQKLRQGGKQAG